MGARPWPRQHQSPFSSAVTPSGVVTRQSEVVAGESEIRSEESEVRSEDDGMSSLDRELERVELEIEALIQAWRDQEFVTWGSFYDSHPDVRRWG